VNPKETSHKDTAVEEGSKLLFDKAWHIPIAFPLACQERFQVPGHHSIHRILFRIARPVGRIGNHEVIAGCKRRRNA